VSLSGGPDADALAAAYLGEAVRQWGPTPCRWKKGQAWGGTMLVRMCVDEVGVPWMGQNQPKAQGVAAPIRAYTRPTNSPFRGAVQRAAVEALHISRLDAVIILTG